MHPERGNWNTWVDGTMCDRIKQSATATTRNKMYANELFDQYLCSVYLPRRAKLRHFRTLPAGQHKAADLLDIPGYTICWALVISSLFFTGSGKAQFQGI